MKKKFTIIFLLLLTLPTLFPFFNSQFFYTQDHIFVARLHQMSAALFDGHFPVRWAPDLRFGEPIFNYYAPLPYYFGALIKLSGISFIWVAKMLFILSTVFSALTMYLFLRKLFPEKGAFLGALLYTYAPYRAVDLYIRGALSEAWAFVFFPLIFYCSLLVSERPNFFRISILSLSLAGLFLTHNVTTLIFLPFLVLWWIYLLIRQRNWKIIYSFVGAFGLSLALAAFFLLPAAFEREFIQTKYLTVGYFDFRAHFVAFYQFFSTFWGYGSSLWGPKDDMSFQLGLMHWATLLLAGLFGFLNRKDKKLIVLFSFLGFSFLLSLFLQHNKSAFIWEAIPIMAFIQFPWRFLAISIFIVAIIGASISSLVKFKILYFALIAAVILVNVQYFKPREFVEDSFFDKFLSIESMQKGVDLTKDYLPIWVKIDRVEYFGTPRADQGEINFMDFKQKTGEASGNVSVLSDSVIEMPITYFPGWQVKANGNPVSLSESSVQGLISFKLPKGDYKIETQLKNTPIRTAGNLLSAVSIILVAFILIFKRNKS